MAMTGITAAVVGTVVGAVVGGALGAIGSLVTGGDIGEGALSGAFAGALGGAFAGFSAPAVDAPSLGASNGSYGVLQSDVAGGVTAKANSAISAAQTAVAPEAVKAGGLSSILDSPYGAGAMLQMGGSLLNGQGAGAMAEANREAAVEDRDAQFAQRMMEIDINHQNNMAQLAAQADEKYNDDLAIARLNNESAMARQQAQQGHESTMQTANWQNTADVQQKFNNSVAGVDTTVFQRPVFDFSNATKFEQVASGGKA
jgi:hypothetical protein